jgi:DNA-binding LacI/PurR family transcriptional regulator
VARGPFEPTFGVTAACDLFTGPKAPSALVAANHEATPALLQEIGRMGIAIPAQLSFVAIEDADALRYWHPAITVVDTDPVTVGELALAALLARLDPNLPTAPWKAPAVVPVQLIERSSCAQVPNRAGSPSR